MTLGPQRVTVDPGRARTVMPIFVSSSRRIAFGVYEADLRSGELLKNGKRVRLQAQPFQLLAMLAPHFDLDLKKTMFAPFFRFHACNLACARELRGTFDRDALQR